MFLIVLLLLQSCLFNAAAQVALNGADHYDLDGDVYLLAEDAEHTHAGIMWQQFRQDKFERATLSGNSINLGFVKKIYWVGFSVVNPTDHPFSLEAGVANNGVYHLEYYLFDHKTGRMIDSVVTGEYHDFYTRVIRNRHYYFPLQVQPDEGYDILYRADMRGNSFQFPLRLLTPEYRENHEKSQYIFYIFFCGVLAFIAFFSLVTFLWLKEWIYLFYSLYVWCNCLLFLGDGDFDFELLYPHCPALATITPAAYGSGIVLFVLQFMNRFLLLKTSRPLLYKLSNIWSLLLLLLIVVLPFAYNPGTVAYREAVFYYGSFCIIGGWLLQVCCILARIRDGFQPAYLYGIAIITLFVAATLYILNAYGIISFSSISHNYILIGFTAEIIILSFALVYHYNYSLKQNRTLTQEIATQQLTFSHQLLQAQEEERRRLARDLHDDLGATLSTLKLHLGNPTVSVTEGEGSKKYVEKGIALISKATDDLRQISHDLLPDDFIGQGLFDVLRQRILSVNSNSNTRFSLILEGEEKKLENMTAITLYRIVNETITNIIRHAQASEATVQLSVLNEQAQLIVEDNGVGFDAGLPAKGIGMKNIHSRVGFLKGSIIIDSSSRGTSIIIEIPLNNHHDRRE